MTDFTACQSERKPCVIAIVGANASGKSDLGIQLAKEFNGEVISADSRQVYKKMNLGTGKVEGPLLCSSGWKIQIDGREFIIAPRESKGILHWLIDVVEPEESFTVFEFQKIAIACIKDILKREHLPILVGGTGLYVRAVIEGLVFPKVICQESLRAELGKKSSEELKKTLLQIDPGAGKIVDLKNPRRMIRALEVLLTSGEPLTTMRRKAPVFFHTLTLGIRMDREELNKRIEERLIRRLEMGMIHEVEELIKCGITGERLEAFGLEYRYIYRFLSNRLNYDEMKTQLYREICRFGKRQMTWFKKYGDVKWISEWNEAKSLVENFLIANQSI